MKHALESTYIPAFANDVWKADLTFQIFTMKESINAKFNPRYFKNIIMMSRFSYNDFMIDLKAENRKSHGKKSPYIYLLLQSYIKLRASLKQITYRRAAKISFIQDHSQLGKQQLMSTFHQSLYSKVRSKVHNKNNVNQSAF